MDKLKREILSKTHYGLNIFAYILKLYYTNETVLFLIGRKCKPTKNPFNNNKTTLLIKIENNCAVYSDMDKPIFEGDVFDFAKIHFKLNGKELLDKLNNIMHLRITQKSNFCNQNDEFLEDFGYEVVEKMSPVFSYYNKPITNILPKKNISLIDVYNLIKGDGYVKNTYNLRKIQDAKKARKYKAFNFDYVTFSGAFSKRNDKHLKNHSGLLTIDFDHISNVTKLKEKLIKDEYFETELLFTSPSGDGLKWIIPNDVTKYKHKEYFNAVANYIKYTYRVEVDGSGKDISRACFLPHDPNVIINPKYL
jgi:hypothetical protein